MANQLVSLPDNISLQALIKAIRTVAAQGIPSGYKESTGYDVLFEGHRFPPKPIVGMAATEVSGFEYLGKHFKGGLGSKCFRVLESNGFEIVTKSDQSPFPDEIEDGEKHYEGLVKKVSVNRYERSKNARDKCIKHFGAVCGACGLNFSEKYGIVGEGFIHVHHLVPVSEINEEYVIDPITDLIPVCPNCHAMIHKRKPPFSIQEIQEFLR